MRAFAAVAAVFTLLIANTIISSQDGRKASIDGISALGEFREPFLMILERAVKAQEAQAWESLYRIQWPVAIEHERLAKFVAIRNQRDWRLIDFRLVRIDAVAPPRAKESGGTWNVLGCALIEESGKSTTREGMIPVYLVNGEWLTGEVGLLVKMDSPKSRSRCHLNGGISLPHA